MEFKLKFTLKCCLVILFTQYAVHGDEVPCILWNIKGDALAIKPVSALTRDDDIFKENIMAEDTKFLVFAMERLSLEDFSSYEMSSSANTTLQHLQRFLDERPYMFMSSVKAPLQRLHELHCGVEEIVVDQNIDVQQIVTAFTQSCVVILHISDSGILKAKAQNPEYHKKMFQPNFANPLSDVVGIFTSEKSSWLGSKSDVYRSRNMLQAEEAATSQFVNVKGCMLMYVDSATVKAGNYNVTDLPLPADTEGTSCGNETAVLQLSFKPSGNITSVVLRMEFMKYMGSWITKSTITLTGKEVPEGDLSAKSDLIEAPLGNSFNCRNLRLKTNSTLNVVLTLNQFQVQPFPGGDKFGDNFDCVPFFTIPIWMGVFVSLIFIVIINTGIYALFSVHTMDRFDDPKGKTISVSTGND